MLNETFLLKRLRKRGLGSNLFQCVDTDFYLETLYEDTLEAFSSFYPKLIKGVKITQANAIPTKDPINGGIQFHRYKIPKLNPEDEYIGIEQYHFPGQHMQSGILSGFGGALVEGVFDKVHSLQPIPQVRYSATFEAPDYCLVHPYRTTHTDFVLVMQRMCRLSEIPFGLQELFIRLFICDCKIAIYTEFPSARETGTINGVEVNTNIADFANATSERQEILDQMNEDFITNPERFEALMSNNNGGGA